MGSGLSQKERASEDLEDIRWPVMEAEHELLRAIHATKAALKQEEVARVHLNHAERQMAKKLLANSYTALTETAHRQGKSVAQFCDELRQQVQEKRESA